MQHAQVQLLMQSLVVTKCTSSSKRFRTFHHEEVEGSIDTVMELLDLVILHIIANKFFDFGKDFLILLSNLKR